MRRGDVQEYLDNHTCILNVKEKVEQLLAIGIIVKVIDL